MADKTGDVMFTLSGTDYNYMLAQDEDGNKSWSVEPLYYQPPILLKNKIELTILAAPDMREADDDVLQTRTLSTVKGELRTLIDSQDLITLDGYDDETYYVLFAQQSGKITAIYDRSGRIVNYAIQLFVWDMYHS